MMIRYNHKAPPQYGVGDILLIKASGLEMYCIIDKMDNNSYFYTDLHTLKQYSFSFYYVDNNKHFQKVA